MIALIGLWLGAALAQDGIDAHGFHPNTTAPDAGAALSVAAPYQGTWAGLLLDVADDPVVWVSEDATGTRDEGVAVDALWTAQLGVGARPIDALQFSFVVPVHLTDDGTNTTASPGDLGLAAAGWLISEPGHWLGFAPTLRAPTGALGAVGPERVSWTAEMVAGIHRGPITVSGGAGFGGSDQPIAARLSGGLGFLATEDIDVVVELTSSAALSDVTAWGGNANAPRYRAEALLSGRWNPGPVGLVAGLGRGLAAGPGSPNIRGILGLSWIGRDPAPEPEAVEAVAQVEPLPPEPEPEAQPEPDPVLTVPFSIRVTDTGGAPLASTIRLVGPAEQPDLASSPDRDGEVKTALEPGTWTVNIWSEGYAGQQHQVELESDPVHMGVALGPSMVRIEAKEVVILEQIHFETDKAEIQRDSDGLLSDIAVTLISRPDITRLEVQGHTDDRASDAYNLRLSQARVDAVVERLLAQGVGPQRLRPIGYGESAPIADNRTADGQAANRRVQFVIMDQDAP